MSAPSGAGAASSPDVREVAVIGAGFGGLCAAIRLREAGIDDVVVLEKADEVGGTWRDNTYPGAACDVMSLLYSFSFAPSQAFSRGYAPQPEILDYLRDVVERQGLRPSIRFGAEVVGLAFDQDADQWRIDLADGDAVLARTVVSATGPLHVPRLPDIPGREEFTGTAFHSARWRHDIDLAGRRVAVVGSGASAVQIVPAVADVAAHLDVYQRTPNWVLPRPDHRVRAVERAAYRFVPGLQRSLRTALYLAHESITVGFLDPRYMGLLRSVAQRHLRRSVPDPALRARLTPDYEIGCKRIVMSSDYLPALAREDVELVTDDVAAITPTGIRTADGTEREVDVIVWATGFHVTDAAATLPAVGRGGRSLHDVWADGPEAYLGVAVHGFPNLFTVMGPNTGVGNQSIVVMIEAQVRHIVDVIATARRCGATRVEVKAHAQADENRRLQRASQGTVWTSGGCTSWYLDDEGVNRAVWPGTTVGYRRRLRRADLADYEMTSVDDREDDGAYHGPGVVIFDDGTEVPVVAHVLAVYQPQENTVRWSGRVEHHPDLRRLHRRAAQPVRLRLADHDAVEAVLVDEDPWGGSTITGLGQSPYPTEVEQDFAELFGTGQEA
ncbi:MAG TPA: FAD-dependent oxidoreductase [Acidimicrobiales bacterium]|nr:FAD-dependent oxidoreductase [Acidimicrobiales bacterium]